MTIAKKLSISTLVGLIALYLATTAVFATVPNNSVTSAKIVNGSITAADLAAGSVRAYEIAANAVGASEIATDAVRASEIAANSVGSSELAANITLSNLTALDGVTILGYINLSSVDVSGVFNLGTDVLMVADDGTAAAAAATLTPTSSFVEVSCLDANGCDVTMGEGSALEGDVLLIVGISVNVNNFADTAGVSELAGAFVLGNQDSLMLVYGETSWVEVSRSNN